MQEMGNLLEVRLTEVLIRGHIPQLPTYLLASLNVASGDTHCCVEGGCGSGIEGDLLITGCQCTSDSLHGHAPRSTSTLLEASLGPSV